MRTIKPFPVTREEYPPLRDRIAARIEVVDMNYTSPCWVMPIEMWDDGKGYKKVRWRCRTVYVHRAMYEIDVGPVPQALVLDHKCRVRRCCNPEHLEPVTVEENTNRGDGVHYQYKSVGAKHEQESGRSAADRREHGGVRAEARSHHSEREAAEIDTAHA